jgi:site-specific DNA recombinase
MVRVIIYLRVSTEEQALLGMGLMAQLDACRLLATREGWVIVAVFTDEGISASLPFDKRPALLDAIGTLTRGDILLVMKRDRIFRADPFTNAVIERAIEKQGARIISVAGEGTGDDDPSSILMRRIIDAFGEYERLMIAFRTRAAMRAKKAREQRVGQVPYGRCLDPDGVQLHKHEAELRAVDLVHELRSGGLSLRKIAELLTVQCIPTKNGGAAWRASSVHELLKRSPNGTANGQGESAHQ